MALESVGAGAAPGLGTTPALQPMRCDAGCPAHRRAFQEKSFGNVENFTSTAAEQLKIALRKKVGRFQPLCACGSACCRSRPETGCAAAGAPAEPHFPPEAAGRQVFPEPAQHARDWRLCCHGEGRCRDWGGRLCSACQLSRAP